MIRPFYNFLEEYPEQNQLFLINYGNLINYNII